MASTNGIDILTALLAGAPMGAAPQAPPLSGGNAADETGSMLAQLLSRIPNAEHGGAGGGPRLMGGQLPGMAPAPGPGPAEIMERPAAPAQGAPRLNLADSAAAQSPDAAGGKSFLGMDMSKLRGFMGDVAGGIAPNPASGLASFAQGMSGSIAGRTARDAAKAKAELDAEDRKLALEERGWKREDMLADNARADRTAGIAEARLGLTDMLTQARIREINAKGGLNGLSTKDLLGIETLAVNHYADMLGLSSSGGMSAAKRAEAEAKVMAYRDELRKRLTENYLNGTGLLPDDEGLGDEDDPFPDPETDEEDPAAGVVGMGGGGPAPWTGPKPDPFATTQPFTVPGQAATTPAAAAPAAGGDGKTDKTPINVSGMDAAAQAALPSGVYVTDGTRIYRKK
jgi:hypothetical protein